MFDGPFLTKENPTFRSATNSLRQWESFKCGLPKILSMHQSTNSALSPNVGICMFSGASLGFGLSQVSDLSLISNWSVASSNTLAHLSNEWFSITSFLASWPNLTLSSLGLDMNL